MSVIGSNILAGASGSAGGDALYVDDVFSAWTYDGTGSAQTITNGIDLDGEGGLVWFKQRTTTYSHALIDTERGATKWLRSNSNETEATDSAAITSFNSNGFTLGTSDQVNNNTQDHVSWTFRKAPGFFDVVTFTTGGTLSSSRALAHNLGSAPGFVIIKGVTVANDWLCYHRSLGQSSYVALNSTNAQSTTNQWWTATAPTSTTFYLDETLTLNTNQTYVAYLFAHDDQSFGTGGDEAIIKCDQYVGAGSGTVKEVDLGFEPQWVMIKKADGVENWTIFDNMRDVSTNGNDAYLVPNEVDVEVSNADRINFTSTGFSLNVGNMTNQLNSDFIYVAIRRPHKPPEAGTDVFQALTFTGTSATEEKKDTNFPVDLMHTHRTSGGTPYFISRLQGTQRYIGTSGTSGEGSGAGVTDFGPDYLKLDSSGVGADNGSAYINLYFRRAPGFLDVVAYDGSSSAQTITHNLEAVPEMMIIKKRSASDFWAVYHSGIGNTDFLRLNTDADASTGVLWNDTTPTSSVFTVGHPEGAVNESGATYIAYLFATLSGVSKVGTYDGTGNNVDVACGFAAGARFVMIKRTDVVSSGDWYYWDTTRGIVSGNDPFMRFNVTTAATTDTDYIDPLNAGFTVTSSAPAALNASGGTYAFFAIS